MRSGRKGRGFESRRLDQKPVKIKRFSRVFYLGELYYQVQHLTKNINPLNGVATNKSTSLWPVAFPFA